MAYRPNYGRHGIGKAIIFLSCVFFYLLMAALRSRCGHYTVFNKNSSGDEIANVNFFHNIAHVDASAYAH